MNSLGDFSNIEMVIATRENLKEVHLMWLEAADWMKSKRINQWLENQLTMEAVEYCYSISEMFITKCNGISIGTFFIVRSDPHLWGEESNSHCGYIHRLIVKREYAGRGLGYKLLDLAEQYMRTNNLTYFRLDCMADSPNLNAFYQKAGFTFKRRINGEGWSANLYEKPL